MGRGRHSKKSTKEHIRVQLVVKIALRALRLVGGTKLGPDTQNLITFEDGRFTRKFLWQTCSSLSDE